MRDEVLKLRDVWAEGYQRLLEEGRERGAVRILPDTRERRRHPRFLVRSEDVASSQEPTLAIQDMSISGLAFQTGLGHFADRRMTVSLASVFSTEVDILECTPLEDPNGTEAPRFRVRCRFRDEDHGLQFLTLTLELERVERD